MKNKVLILANNSDGLYRFRNELIKELGNKFEITASTPFDNFVPELQEICSRVIQTEFQRRGINPIKDLRLLATYRKLISDIRPDYVITYTIKPNIYGGIISRFKKIPYAINITGLGTVFEKDGIVQKIVVLLYKFALKRAKVVFFENSGDRDIFVQKTQIPLNQTHVLHGAGVNTETYAYQTYPNNEVVKFLFVGRVMKEKGVDELFAAMQRLVEEGQKCFLDVVGPFEEDYEEIIAKYEREGWLKYHGFQQDVRPFITASDCFVLPSYHEGMANTNLESASSGRPVITSNIPGCKEAVIEDVSGYLCEPQNIESLYASMAKMIAIGSEGRALMGCEGRKHMEAVFDKKKVVAETIKHLV